MQTVHFGRALYYPHIFPQSRQWLRTAALYHDGIGRIVPKHFVPLAYDRHSGPELLRDFEALQAAGFIEDKYPNDVLPEVSEDFIEFLAPLLQGQKRKERLRKKLGSRDWQPYNMFREKIEPGLIDLLEPEGLIRPVNDYEVEFDASIGGLYMLFLARQMAKHQPIVSDDPTYEALAHVPIQQDTTGAPVDRGLLLANAIFTSAVPIDIESVDIHDLIRFRQDFAGERIAFYEWIADFRADLSKITDQKQLQQAVEHHAATIRTRMCSLKEKLRLLKLKCTTGVFYVFYARHVDEHVGSGNQGPGPVGRRRHFGRSGHRRKCGVGASDHEGRCASELCAFNAQAVEAQGVCGQDDRAESLRHLASQ
jgi:hypothetical protein